MDPNQKWREVSDIVIGVPSIFLLIIFTRKIPLSSLVPTRITSNLLVLSMKKVSVIQVLCYLCTFSIFCRLNCQIHSGIVQLAAKINIVLLNTIKKYRVNVMSKNGPLRHSTTSDQQLWTWTNRRQSIASSDLLRRISVLVIKFSTEVKKN